jgi:hypothetical protein
MYNPERDYAYITPTLMRIAIERLEANEPQENVDWRKDQHITSEDLNNAVTALANAQRDFVNAADPVSSFEQALLRHDFYSYKPAVRQYIFAALGEVCFAAWFAAVREVSMVGEESPAQTDMARFTAAVREFVNKNKGVTHDANFMAEHLRMQQDVLQVRLQNLMAELKTRHLDLHKCREELALVKAATEKKSESFICRLFDTFRKKK